VDCGGLGDCLVAAGDRPVCLCGPGSVAVGLDCVEAPQGAIPETAISDAELAEPHPVTGVDYVPGELVVYAAEGHDAAVLTAAFKASEGEVLAYKPSVRRYQIRFAGPPTAVELGAIRDQLKARSDVAMPGVKSKRALATITLEHSGWGVRGRSPLFIQCPAAPSGAAGSFEARRADPPYPWPSEIGVLRRGRWLRGHTGSNRVMRGGSWNNEAGNSRAAQRKNNNPANRNNNYGFRLSSSSRRRDGRRLRTPTRCQRH
jgi:hypothetical protein